MIVNEYGTTYYKVSVVSARYVGFSWLAMGLGVQIRVVICVPMSCRAR
jgi:hypothetical protein